MPHVRTQLRNAVRTRLSTVPSIKGAHNMTRHERKFQPDNFPAAFVAIAEEATPSPGSRYKIAVQVAVESNTGDAEDVIDAVCVDIEKALVKPDLGIGKITNWGYAGTTSIDAQPTEDGLLLVETLHYSCDIQTLDSSPDRNLHP